MSNIIDFPEKERFEVVVDEKTGRKRRSDCMLWTNLNNVAVKPIDKFSVRGDGIVLPTSGQYHIRGTVVAVGEGMIDDNGTRMPMHVQIGDRVVLPNPAGVQVDDYILLNEVNVLAIDVVQTKKNEECTKGAEQE